MLNSKTRRRSTALTLAITLAAGVGRTAWPYEVNDTLEISGILTSAAQCQQITRGAPHGTLCRGAVVFQPEITYNATKQDQFFAKLGFAAWNGLNPVSPFALAPWAADLAANVTHIGGSNRNNLLEAWYAHTFEFATANTVQITGGIIDPGVYVDQNAFANDEATQFMNEVFANAHNAVIPSYHWGGVLVWKVGNWALSGVGTSVPQNSDGYHFEWFAAQIDYKLQTTLGEGNYRLMSVRTSRSFLSPAPTVDPNASPVTDPPPASRQRRAGLALSCDQDLGKVVGVFLRVGWQTQHALVDYGAEYSGGFNFKGAGWGREHDTIGLAFAYLPGGNMDIARTDVFETYYRLAFNEHFALSADVQYMQDQYRSGGSTEGWIYGLRATAAF
ncbi:carbohydrate porin [uncultured Thiodictyon sp.]|uniref:carbohydrate porin n=1 Tax=uncultured Thiodictyon sp. TaxID=1846217 RepID=UPI0025EA23D3|nr:carbohydrate porin [uncultured Thiodictyon sp.]